MLFRSHSHRSVAESIHHERELAELKKASAKASQEALRYKQELERKELELSQEREQHRLALEQAALSARSDALAEVQQQIAEEEAGSDFGCHSNTSEENKSRVPPDVRLDPQCPAWEPRVDNHDQGLTTADQ